MANIILKNWEETPGERSLREKGHRTKQNAIMETGLSVGLNECRSSNVGATMQKIAKCLWELRQQAATQGWDDDKVCVTIGMQVRNNWEKDCDGEWQEIGSNAWLDKIARGAK